MIGYCLKMHDSLVVVEWVPNQLISGLVALDIPASDVKVGRRYKSTLPNNYFEVRKPECYTHEFLKYSKGWKVSFDRWTRDKGWMWLVSEIRILKEVDFAVMQPVLYSI